MHPLNRSLRHALCAGCALFLLLLAVSRAEAGIPADAARASDATTPAAIESKPAALPSTLPEAIEAYQHGQIAVAITALTPFANQRQAQAEYYLGLAYLAEGDQQDTMQAVDWLGLAAEQKLPEALFELGQIYDRGIGVPRELDRAIGLYHQAVALQYAPAQVALGVLLVRGDGIMQDYAEAARLFNMAHNYPPAQYRLATLYANGWGLARSLEKAYQLYSMAASKGYGPAQLEAGLYSEKALGSHERRMDDALKWYRYAADKNIRPAQERMGLFYAQGSNVPKDRVLSFTFFSLALDAGGMPVPFVSNQPVDAPVIDRISREGQVPKAIYLVPQAIHSPLEVDRKQVQAYRDTVDKRLTPRQKNLAVNLLKQMRKPGNVLKALDTYLGSADARESQRASAQKKP